MEIQNAMQQGLKLYNVLESVLRRAAKDEKHLTMAELKANPEIAPLVNSPHKVRDTVKVLGRQGFVLDEGEGIHRRYRWNLNAPPYIHSEGKRTRATRQPSPVSDPMKENVVVSKAAPEVAKEIELVVAGVLIVVSRNPLTGRPRITIE